MRRLYFIKSNISTLSGFKLTRCSTIRLEILNSLSDAMEPMGAHERYRLANEDSRGNFCWLPAHQEKGHLSRGMFFSLRYSVTSQSAEEVGWAAIGSACVPMQSAHSSPAGFDSSTMLAAVLLTSISEARSFSTSTAKSALSADRKHCVR